MEKRTIKFRAWDKKEKRIYNWKEFLDIMPINLGVARNWLYFWNKQDYCILMQFTGLHDKNGKEIYEGDIVNFVKTRNKGISEFAYRYRVAFVGTSFVGIGDRRIGGIRKMEEITGEGWEIIGNIYENPELLSPTKPK